MTKTNRIRYTRIVRHFLMYFITLNIEHRYEIGHYYYMKRFSDIKD